jgi:mRNA-degrading endonuclease RelE of RelBE toxin-antitoxin system
MNYEIILSPDAEEQFLKLPPPVQQFLESELNRLAEDPWDAVHNHGTYLGLATLYSFDESVYDQQTHRFDIRFRFKQDEKSLQIIAIGYDPYE